MRVSFRQGIVRYTTDFTPPTAAFADGTGAIIGTGGSVQWNNNGSFGGDSLLIWDDINNRLGVNKATPTETLDITGNILLDTIGNGIKIKEGTNARMGVATLAAGTVTVSNTTVTANTRIYLTSQVDGGTPGWLRVSARTANTSFTITSSSNTDTSTVAWFMVEGV